MRREGFANRLTRAGQPHAGCTRANAEGLRDFVVRVSFNVVHDEDDALIGMQRLHGSIKVPSQIGLDDFVWRADLTRSVHRYLAPIQTFASANRVERNGRTNSVNPGREPRVAAELAKVVEHTNERILRDVLRLGDILRHSQREPEYLWSIRREDSPLRGLITGECVPDETHARVPHRIDYDA
jgi:hypothetical protein